MPQADRMPTIPLSPAQIDVLASRLDPDFASLPPERKQLGRDRLAATLEGLETEGWEVGRRTDRSTFEMAQWMFLRIESNIAGSTPKAVIILSLHMAILSAAILQGDRIVREAAVAWRNLVGLLMVTLFLAAVSALWLAFSSVTPRIAKTTGPRSLLFFGSICRIPKAEFQQAFGATNREEFTQQLIEEVHALAGLADWKHRMFVRAFQIVLYFEIPLMAVIALLVAAA